MPEKKEKQYASDNARLMAEWDWDRNTDIDPSQITLNSHKKVWWKCNKGHEWQALIADRNRGNGCPFCSNKRILKGYNDLQTLNPVLSKEWNFEKNDNLTPADVFPNSNIKVWWKCALGHEWQALISSRNRGCECPYCAGQKVLKGYNDLQTLNPVLAGEWNYQMNTNLKPDAYTTNSNEKVWWRCSKGHEWQATINHRNRGNGCPYCAGQKVLIGYNDLQTQNPTLVAEWNYPKNGALKPENFLPGSEKKIWWRCNKGHEWQATIANRTKGSCCPICISERHTSFPEYAIVFYLRKYGLDVIHSYKAKGYELDVFIPDKKIAIEFDGFYWHKNKSQQDLNKNRKCEKDGIKLYRIRAGLPSLNDTSIDYIIKENQKDFPTVLAEILLKIVENSVDVDLKRDASSIDILREYTEKENSILISSPTIAQEWNYEKNNNLKPENFTASSSKSVWWVCKYGHEWQAPIYSRKSGNGCPYCSGRKILSGCNDLQTINPTIASEWLYDKNGDLKPNNIAANSGKKVWWKCKQGHEWIATVASRNKGSGCPYCAGKFPLKGLNDLLTINPILSEEWNYEKNYELTPSSVLPSSNKKVWWKCSQGHEWQAKISNRNNLGRGCPECAKQKRKKKDTQPES